MQLRMVAGSTTEVWLLGISQGTICQRWRSQPLPLMTLTYTHDQLTWCPSLLRARMRTAERMRLNVGISRPTTSIRSTHWRITQVCSAQAHALTVVCATVVVRHTLIPCPLMPTALLQTEPVNTPPCASAITHEASARAPHTHTHTHTYTHTHFMHADYHSHLVHQRTYRPDVGNVLHAS
jgi:hypothetical protein